VSNSKVLVSQFWRTCIQWDGAEAQCWICTRALARRRLPETNRRWLAHTWDEVENLGILRMVRDVFHLSGLVHFRGDGGIERITLNQADSFASGRCAGLPPLLVTLHIAVSLGEI
jgi:hypothetical protein